MSGDASRLNFLGGGGEAGALMDLIRRTIGPKIDLLISAVGCPGASTAASSQSPRGWPAAACDLLHSTG